MSRVLYLWEPPPRGFGSLSTGCGDLRSKVREVSHSRGSQGHSLAEGTPGEPSFSPLAPCRGQPSPDPAERTSTFPDWGSPRLQTQTLCPRRPLILGGPCSTPRGRRPGTRPTPASRDCRSGPEGRDVRTPWATSPQPTPARRAGTDGGRHGRPATREGAGEAPGGRPAAGGGVRGRTGADRRSAQGGAPRCAGARPERTSERPPTGTAPPGPRATVEVTPFVDPWSSHLGDSSHLPGGFTSTHPHFSHGPRVSHTPSTRQIQTHVTLTPIRVLPHRRIPPFGRSILPDSTPITPLAQNSLFP